MLEETDGKVDERFKSVYTKDFSLLVRFTSKEK